MGAEHTGAIKIAKNDVEASYLHWRQIQNKVAIEILTCEEMKGPRLFARMEAHACMYFQKICMACIKEFEWQQKI